MGLFHEMKRAGVVTGAARRRMYTLEELTARVPMRVLVLETHTYQGVVRLQGMQYDIDPLDVPAAEMRGEIQVIDDLPTPQWWDAPNRLLLEEPGTAVVMQQGPTVNSLKIVAGCDYDPGNAAYRFHTALNEHSPHVSAFVRFADTNPFTSMRQWDGTRDVKMVRALVQDADVIHCHVHYLLPRNVGYANRARAGQLLVRHYHGSMPQGKQHPEIYANLDDALGAILVGARLTLCAVRPDRMEWLPITVPVARYAAMVDRKALQRSKTFRIAHSPTRHDYKGTQPFLDACKRLKAAGVPVEPVLIEGKRHGEALALKATCHATFDSFWLGIQGSGLEGAAMGQAVIAGDPDVAALYKAHIGNVPYTYANDAKSLGDVIERMVKDPAFYKKEARTVNTYVKTWHDYPAVVAQYNAILAKYRRA